MSPETRARLTATMPKIASEFRLLFRDRDTHDPRRARVPTLLVRAAHTTAAARAVIDRLAATMPSVELVEIADAGHMVPVTHAGAVNAAIETHLAPGRGRGHFRRGGLTRRRKKAKENEMSWKRFLAGAAVHRRHISSRRSRAARAPESGRAATAFDPVLDGVACLPDDRKRAALKTYLAAAQRKTEIGPFDPQRVDAPPTGASFVDRDAPLIDGLGKRRHRITDLVGRKSQRYFDQGLALAYGFNHAEARRAFRTAQRLDPDCAMCFWGEALVLGPNINLPMAAADNAPALRRRSQRAPRAARPRRARRSGR